MDQLRICSGGASQIASLCYKEILPSQNQILYSWLFSWLQMTNPQLKQDICDYIWKMAFGKWINATIAVLCSRREDNLNSWKQNTHVIVIDVNE